MSTYSRPTYSSLFFIFNSLLIYSVKNSPEAISLHGEGGGIIDSVLSYRHQTHVFFDIICRHRYHIECVMSCLTSNFKVKDRGHNIDIYVFEFPDIDSLFIDAKHKFLQYIPSEISYAMRMPCELPCVMRMPCVMSCLTFYVMCDLIMFDLEFQGDRSEVKVTTMRPFLKNSLSLFVIVDTKHEFIRYIYYQRYHIECVTSCLTPNFKVKSQGYNIGIYRFELFEVNSVKTDTKFTFSSHRHQEILNNV